MPTTRNMKSTRERKNDEEKKSENIDKFNLLIKQFVFDQLALFVSIKDLIFIILEYLDFESKTFHIKLVSRYDLVFDDIIMSGSDDDDRSITFSVDKHNSRLPTNRGPNHFSFDIHLQYLHLDKVDGERYNHDYWKRRKEVEIPIKSFNFEIDLSRQLFGRYPLLDIETGVIDKLISANFDTNKEEKEENSVSCKVSIYAKKTDIKKITLPINLFKLF
jgi:hypothetical protein